VVGITKRTRALGTFAKLRNDCNGQAFAEQETLACQIGSWQFEKSFEIFGSCDQMCHACLDTGILTSRFDGNRLYICFSEIL
jgi:hypothetical protein